MRSNSISNVAQTPLAVRLAAFTSVVGAILAGGITMLSPLLVTAQTTSSVLYTFNVNGTLHEAASASNSSSPYWWVASGGKLIVSGGEGATIAGDLPSTDKWYQAYAKKDAGSTDGGKHPQNVFRMFFKTPAQNPSAQIYVKRMKDNFANTANIHPYNGESVIARYKDVNNYYYAGIRADGAVVIKKKTNGVYQTLVSKKILSGTYSSSNPDLMPIGQWIGLKFVVTDNASGGPTLTLYTDIGKSGAWTQQVSVIDDAAKFGAAITGAGLVGIQSDFADARFDDFRLADAGATLTTPSTSGTPAPVATTTTVMPVSSSTPVSSPVSQGYDAVVLADTPVMYLAMSSFAAGSEQDKTGRGHTGTYKGGTPASATLPNGDTAAAFNGSSQYLTVPSAADLSIPTSKKLTWEAWIRPDTYAQAKASGDGYVDWMGKCQDYSPTCEWEARIYNAVTPEGRPTRVSAYVFNPSAGLGSAADWQPASALQAGKWIHVVAEYDTTSTPSGCNSAYPGQINIWVNGVKQDMASHMPTGCMSQYKIVPKAGNSPLNIGTMSLDTWFKGAVGKVAVYDRLLSQTEISEHFTAMTGKTPTGSCGATCTALSL